MPKKTTKKTASAKKSTQRKTTPAKKTTVKKTATAKKSAAAKKVPAKKAAAKKAAKAPAKPSKTSAPKSSPTNPVLPRKDSDDDNASSGLSLRLTAALAKVSSTRGPGDVEEKRSGPAPFTLADVREIIQNRTNEEDGDALQVTTGALSPAATTVPTPVATPAQPRPKQSFGAVSMADILGFNPLETAVRVNDRDDESIPKKFRPFYKALLDLREGVEEGLMRHSQENLGVSNRDDSGDLSGYAQHMADAGSENFERDFALSMVSSEQEALQEIDDAIARIRDGSYGVCEITGEPISRDRLKAVPFARYSIEGQREIERNQRRRVERGGIFGTSAEDLATFSDEDADE